MVGSNIDLSIKDVKKAQAALSTVIKETPLDYSNTLSQLTDSQVYLKLENLQKTGSFKVRGAYWKMLNVDRSVAKSVVAASAGNHAQGTAYAASHLNIPCTIVMPENASTTKVAATSGYGASILLSGSNYDESYSAAEDFAKKHSATMIHPFDDPFVIAGQGTVGLEIVESFKDVDIIIAAVGGGGLISGLCVALKEKYPQIKIIGVQASNSASMVESKKNRKLTTIQSRFTIADGIDVKTPGKLTFDIVKKHVDKLITVSDVEIAEAMFLLLERGRIVSEPAGAATVAGLLSGQLSVKGKNVVPIICGGNVDMPLMNKLVTRGLISAGRIVRMVVGLTDKPGALKDVLDVIGSRNANILDVQVDRFYKKIGLGPVEVLISMETKSKEHTKEMLKTLKQQGFTYRLIE